MGGDWLKRPFFGICLTAAMAGGHNQCMAADFYAGKTITIVVGFSAGGVYDQMARLYARHLGRFLPGNPTVVVQNQPGAGSLVTANNLAKLWVGDATRLGIIGSGSVWQPILGDKQAPYDPRSLGWIGGRTRDTLTCAIWHQSPTSTLAALPKTALAVLRPRRSEDSSTTSSCSSVAVWMNSTTAAIRCWWLPR